MEQLTAIFDVGKTNKKLLLFDNDGKVVYESSETLPETKDEDNFPCEDVQLLKEWLLQKWEWLISKKQYNISHLNFAGYGASLVNLDEKGKAVTPLYNYLKPFPAELADKLYKRYGGKWEFSSVTSSPPMGMLNSGLQLFWLKNTKPAVFAKIASSLHLPQYLSFIFSNKKKFSDYTSIGCHTALWDFAQREYHQWVGEENIDRILVPIADTSVVNRIEARGKSIAVGYGLHDSSSALIPYLKNIKEKFLLISTGTWCITLNPFNSLPLTTKELSLDCLCYLTPKGFPVKASRIFLGKEHEFQSQRIEKHFGKQEGYCNAIAFNDDEVLKLLLKKSGEAMLVPSCMEGTGPFSSKQAQVWNLEQFRNCEDAYLQLMGDLTCMLKYSIELVNNDDSKTIFVEGGFGDNNAFMNLLANHFPAKRVKTSFLRQATALGAALQVNESIDLRNWQFKSYEASEISIQLEGYYQSFLKHRGF